MHTLKRKSDSKTPMIGRQFGRWTVLLRAENSNNGRFVRWLCRCECGTERIVVGMSLRHGRSRSCGCLGRELMPPSLTHGHTRNRKPSSEYRSWQDMWDRCRRPRNRAFKDYGGRGICVCERWKSFENFLADMGPRPSPKHSIDRINNDGNYEPGNCRWATAEMQGNNRREKPIAASGARGVHVTKTGLIHAHICDHGRLKHLGTFPSVAAASAAYESARASKLTALAKGG